MGLLEKAGKISDKGKDKPKAKAKASPKKAAKAKVSKKKDVKEPKKAKVRKPRAPRVARVLPDGFDLARPAAKGARSLVDLIVNYGGMIALIGFTATGAFFDPTIMLVGVLVPILINMFVMPYKFNRTVGMFLTRTRYVNSHGNHPNFTHQIFSSLTPFLIMGGVMGIFMGVGNDETTALVVGIIMITIVLIDYVVTRIRSANEQSQNMWDAMYGCWFVVAERTDGDSKWSARLEALGDWGEKRGWGATSNDEEESDDS